MSGFAGDGGFSRYPIPGTQPGFKEPTRRSDTVSYSVPNGKTAVLDLNKGDMVSHAAFGRGMVLSVMKMGGDALLEIAFDDIGTKKLMAKTASAHMKKL